MGSGRWVSGWVGQGRAGLKMAASASEGWFFSKPIAAAAGGDWNFRRGTGALAAPCDAQRRWLTGGQQRASGSQARERRNGKGRAVMRATHRSASRELTRTSTAPRRVRSSSSCAAAEGSVRRGWERGVRPRARRRRRSKGEGRMAGREGREGVAVGTGGWGRALPGVRAPARARRRSRRRRPSPRGARRAWGADSRRPERGAG